MKRESSKRRIDKKQIDEESRAKTNQQTTNNEEQKTKKQTMGDIAKDIQSSFPSERVKAFINIKYTANWINSQENEFFKPFGISPQQFNILRILKGAGEAIKVQQIKDRMIERAPNATRLMDKLCAKDLIERIPCPTDRRVVHIAITDDGQKLLSTIAESMPNNDWLGKLTEEEASQLSNLLDKIR